MITEEDVDRIAKIIATTGGLQRNIPHNTRVYKEVLTHELLGKKVGEKRIISLKDHKMLMHKNGCTLILPARRDCVDISELGRKEDREIIANYSSPESVEKPEITREEIEKWCKGLKPINTTEDIHRIRSSIVVFCDDHGLLSD